MEKYFQKENGISLIGLIFIVVIALVLIFLASIIIPNMNTTEEDIIRSVVGNSIGNSEKQNQKNVNEKNKMSLEDAKEKYEKYLEIKRYQDNSIAVFPDLLVELGLMDENDIKESTDPSEELVSKVKYSDFESKMLEYISNAEFENKYSSYKEKDGYVIYTSGAGEIPFYELYSFDFIKEENDISYYKAQIVSDDYYYGDGEKRVEDCLDEYIVEFYNKNGNNIIIANIFCSKIDTKNNSKLELGNYILNEHKEDEAGVTFDDSGITLKENNLFDIYLGYGSHLYGTYEINDDKVICHISTYFSEEGDFLSIETRAEMIFDIESKKNVSFESFEDFIEEDEIGEENIKPAFEENNTYTLK